MKYFRYFVAVALFISVVINFSLLTKVGNLEYQMNSVLDFQNQLIQNVDSQTNNIEAVLNEFKQEQSWISTIDHFVDIKGSQAEIAFEWQIKELENNSNIVFHYSFGENKDYLEIPVENKNNGLFNVTIPVDVEIEPQWMIQIIKPGNQEEQSSEKEIEERKFDRYRMNYFVSVSYNDIVKNSEIHTTNLDAIGSMDYGLLDVMVDISNNNYHVSVLNSVGSSENIIPLKKVYVMKYQDGKLIDEEQLISEDSSDSPKIEPVSYWMKDAEKLEYTRLVVKVVYDNGKTFKKEIYSKK